MLEIEALDNGLAAFGGKSRSIGRLLRTQTPIDQGIVDELES
jgi:hypothetical protein